MSNVQVLLPSGNLKPLGGSAASAVEAAAASTSMEGCFPRPPLRRPHPQDSESDSSAYPQPKKLKKTRRRNKKKKSKRRNNGVVRICKPYAPFNSNQFLMEEYDTLHYEDIDMKTSAGFRPELECGDGVLAVGGAPSAGGDGEDVQWEEFCKKEFLGTYQAITVQRLDNLTKAQLVEEYLTLEDELDELKQRLEDVTKEDQARGMIIECDPDSSDLQPGEVLLDAETAAKISVFKDEIRALELENKRLQEENVNLRRSRTSSSSSSSSSSDSWSSSSSSSSSSSDSSSDSEDDREKGDDNNNHSAEGVEVKAAPTPLEQLSASVNMTCEVIQCSEDNGSSAAGHESSVGSHLLPVQTGGIASWVEGSEEELLQGEQVVVLATETVASDSTRAVKCVEDNNLDVHNELLDSGLDDNNEILSEDNDS